MDVRLHHQESAWEDTAAGQLALLLRQARQAALLVEEKEELETWRSLQTLKN